MSKGIEVTIYDVPEGRTVEHILRSLRALGRPLKVYVDANGPGQPLLEYLQHNGYDARPLRKRRRKVISRDEAGTPLFVEGPDDELAAHFDGEWRGQYYLCEWDDGWRAYELAEVPAEPVPTLRWQRVLDREVLKKLGPWRFA